MTICIACALPVFTLTVLFAAQINWKAVNKDYKFVFPIKIVSPIQRR